MRALGHPAVKPLVFGLCLLPAAWLFWAAATDQLGDNPAEALIRALGDWALRALVLVLAITPLRVMAGWPQLARFRRMAGLFSFFYASLHWLSYAWFDMGFVWVDIVADVPIQIRSLDGVRRCFTRRTSIATSAPCRPR